MARKGHPAPHVKERPINHYKGFPPILVMKMVGVYTRNSVATKTTNLSAALRKVREGYAPRVIAGYTPGEATVPLNVVKMSMRPKNTAREQARRIRQRLKREMPKAFVEVTIQGGPWAA